MSVLPSPDCAADASSVWMTEVCLQVSTPQSECHSTFAEWPGGGAAAILHTDSLVHSWWQPCDRNSFWSKFRGKVPILPKIEHQMTKWLLKMAKSKRITDVKSQKGDISVFSSTIEGADCRVTSNIHCSDV